jgi:hypothetical protein
LQWGWGFVVEVRDARLLRFISLLLASPPASAAIYQVQTGSYEVIGDFGPLGFAQGIVSFDFEATVNPGIYDPLKGPFFGYLVTVTASGFGQAQGCSFSQLDSRCGRTLQNHPTFSLTDGDGRANLMISGVANLTNMSVSKFDIFVSLPDGFTIAAPVPEPSTWAMLLIGFAGIGFAAYRKQRDQYTFFPSASCRHSIS